MLVHGFLLEPLLQSSALGGYLQLTERMHTYFSRHTIGLEIDQTTRDMLWNERRVAIHYPERRDGKIEAEDNPSLDPADYPGRSAGILRVLLELARDGGFVCAQHYGHEESIVGLVAPGTPIDVLSGVWSDRSYPKRTAVLKSVRLTNAKLISPADSAAILVGRPRQGTLMHWWRAGASIQHLVEETFAEPALDSLSPDQQEILCSEFLRLDITSDLGLPTLAHLLLPVGRTMKDLDIYGLSSDGQIIMAQVTHSPLSHVRGKLERLRHYAVSKSSQLLLFCQHERIEQIDGVTVVPIDRAYREFISSSSGPSWLSAALHRRSDS